MSAQGWGPRGAALSAALAALLLAWPVAAGARGPAGAEPPVTDLTELSLDQLMDVEVESVYGASRFAQRGLDAPTRVTVLTADDIRTHGYRTVAEALAAVNGVYVSWDRNYAYVGLRGLGHVDDYNARTLVLVDEHRLNDDLFEGTLVGTDFPIDLEQVDRIEVIRGPSSAIYGSNALLGVINIVTRRAKQTQGFELAADVGEQGTRGARVAVRRRFAPRVSLQLTGSLHASDGLRNLYVPGFDAVAHDLDGDAAQRVYADLTAGDLRVVGVLGTRKKDVPTGAWGTAFDAPDNWTLDRRGWLDASYHRVLTSRTDVSARAYADLYDYQGSYPYDYTGSGDGPITINRDDDHGRWYGLETSAHHVVSERDELVVGGEFRENARQHQRNFDVDPYWLYDDDSHRTRVWAVFAENALALAPRLRLVSGVRHDRYSTFGGSTHPRIGLIATPFGRSSLKAIYGSAFRVPTIYELYYGGDGYTANEALKPETYRTGEVSFESYLARHYHVSGSWFVYRAEDYIQQLAVDSTTAEYFNDGHVDGRGVELELTGRWPAGTLRVSGVLQHTRLARDDRRPANSPERMLQLSGEAPLVRGLLTAAADVRAIGERRNPAGESVAAYAVTDVNLLAHRPAAGWSVSLGVRNLFDARYGDVAGAEVGLHSVPQDRRTVRVRLDVRF